jgi:hypothetical protein
LDVTASTDLDLENVTYGYTSTYGTGFRPAVTATATDWTARQET